MSDQMTRARPYACALFEIALEENTLAQWLELLQVLSIAGQESQLIGWLTDPARTKEAAIEFIIGIIKEAVPSHYQVLDIKVDNLLALLFENNQLVNLPQIHQQFALLEAEHKQCMNVEVISATQMDEHQRAALEKHLSQRFHTEVQAIYHIDSSLMGGVVVRAGNWVMDGSIKGKIARLNEDLLS